MTNPTGRKVTANIGLTLDGRYNGPGGPGDAGAIVRYATTEVARNHLTRIWQDATTALLGIILAAVYLLAPARAARTGQRRGFPGVLADGRRGRERRSA